MTLTERVESLFAGTPPTPAVRAAVKAKIGEAEKASTAIADRMVQTRTRMETCWCNGFGVLKEPVWTRADLVQARTTLDEAIKILDAAKWPTSEDYDVTEWI